MMSKIDLNAFKDRLPQVKSAIRQTLKVDAGTQNTYDIMAAAHGYRSYHSVKALAEESFYDLRCNLGTRDKPFHMIHELGYSNSLAVTQSTAMDVLKDCQQFQIWYLYKDGENTHIKFETQPTPDKGLAYQIEVTGDTINDVEMALEEVSRRLDNVRGFDKNESGSFSFQRAGEEHDPDEMFIDSWKFAIFDAEKLLVGSNNTPTDLMETWKGDDEDLKPWSGDLILGEGIDADDLRTYAQDPDMDNETFHALGIDDFGQPFRAEGTAQELISTLDDVGPDLVSLYQELDRK